MGLTVKPYKAIICLRPCIELKFVLK